MRHHRHHHHHHHHLPSSSASNGTTSRTHIYDCAYDCACATHSQSRSPLGGREFAPDLTAHVHHHHRPFVFHRYRHSADGLDNDYDDDAGDDVVAGDGDDDGDRNSAAIPQICDYILPISSRGTCSGGSSGSSGYRRPEICDYILPVGCSRIDVTKTTSPLSTTTTSTSQRAVIPHIHVTDDVSGGGGDVISGVITTQVGRTRTNKTSSSSPSCSSRSHGRDLDRRHETGAQTITAAAAAAVTSKAGTWTTSEDGRKSVAPHQRSPAAEDHRQRHCATVERLRVAPSSECFVPISFDWPPPTESNFTV